MDKLLAMRSFVAIVDRGSLTAAATDLHRSLPTMVRTLAALEESLGTRLLRRTTRRMSLTAEGRVYLERCRSILGDIEEAEASVTRDQVEPRGQVRMTAPVLFGQMHVAPALSEFLNRFGEVQIELLLLDRVVNLVEEGIDLAIRIGHLADSTMVAVPVSQVRRVVCASPALLRTLGIPAHPSEMSEHPCVRFRGINPGDSWSFQDAGREISVKTRGNFTCNQAAAAAQACAEGLGFGMFLSYQVEPLVRAKRLEIVLADFELPSLPVSLVYPEARLVSTRLRVLLDWLKKTLSG
ncbi:MAG: LysR family transcriptional regulator [Gammaproteobacteria bacterium]|jgi:DNA-binding transcriptional LysR family regulator|nr:LysR family transcriptional regulator [Gammaproteobacteria bacterium]NCF82572.1 LysR family transcriptional regulator [Pseudomonadota bacterium]